MKSLDQYIENMNKLLSELIQVAKQLRDMSFQVISEEELSPLQKRQEELLATLESIDQTIQKNYSHQIKSEVRENFHDQLQIFQKLNQEFIQNLNASHGLIQFELRSTQEEEPDFSTHLSLLKKAAPSPKASKTKKIKEEEGS